MLGWLLARAGRGACQGDDGAGLTLLDEGAPFLGTRTVEWHLGKVYNMLGVSSRRDLRQALASIGHAD
jgi:hypothetical protein